MSLLIQLIKDHSTILVMLLIAAIQSMSTPTKDSPSWYKYLFTFSHSITLAGLPRVLSTKKSWEDNAS